MARRSALACETNYFSRLFLQSAAAVPRLPFRILFPVGGDAVVGVYFRSPGRIGHIGPIVLIEARSVLQRLLIHIQDEALLVLVHLKRAPRHREQLAPDAENSAEGKH